MIGDSHYRGLNQSDPELYGYLEEALDIDENGIVLIPSRNYRSRAVREAEASIAGDYYSEGYSGKRYYPGNAAIDRIESLAIERAKEIFGAEYANVQPLSGSPANIAVYMALLQPGDTFMGLDLKAGGHLTHGSPVNFSGKIFNCVHYNVDEDTHLLDYDMIWKIAKECKPKLIVSGLTSYPRTIDFEKFQNIADDVGAKHLADISHIAGPVATKHIPSPVPHADFVTLTTHKTLRGSRGAIILCKKEYADNIDRAVFPGLQGGPHENMIAGIAAALGEILDPDVGFSEYSGKVLENAKHLSEELKNLGFSLITDGTDNHLMLVNYLDTGMTGRIVQNALEDVGIYGNMNGIPFDPNPPGKPSGGRYGTPAATTRGMGPEEMRMTARLMRKTIDSVGDEKKTKKIREEVRELCGAFPIPGYEYKF